MTEINPIGVDEELAHRQLTAGLTKAERSIFERLQASAHCWLSPRDLAEATVGWPTTTIKTHVFRLRAKLAGTGWRIETRRGYGYRLQRETPDA